LSHTDVLRYLAHAEVFVLDTRYEGLSHLILEALAVGTPVATTAAGGNPEVVKNGETGLVFPYEDVEAIRACVGKLRPDTELWKTCTAGGRALVNGFTKERMIQAVMDALS
jgi:glycosyltransferase involved in cell wall biosynthesis